MAGVRRGWTAGAALAALVTAVAVWAAVRTVDSAALARAFRELIDRPMLTLAGLAAFGSAFLIRALIWRRVLAGLTLGHAWAAVHAALAGNHVLPFRLGEPLRVVSVVKRAGIPAAEAVASTITLRAADLLTLVGLAWVLGARSLSGFGSAAGGAAAVVGAAGLLGLIWMWKLRDRARLRRPGMIELAGASAAWVAEAGLVWAAARAAGIGLSLSEAVLVACVSVAAQAAAVAPGGFGTYEAAAVTAYMFLGRDPGTALAAALAAHALKTFYSIAAGIPALLTPAPGLLGRFRVPREIRARRAAPDEGPAGGPVVLFMPAYNEEASVGEVVRRVPDRVRDRRVVTLVIDDGSDDATAERARQAGAEVLSLADNRGLGAAVRTGLIRSLAMDPAAVVFCDADSEYAPEEIEQLAGPILDGRADYVVGSRFMGEIKHMLPHRRLGNLVLTRMLAFTARTRITDGQSGYRAFSPAAAADAEVIHDYNYAQVITLDLIAKGYRYHEVPISYRFRTTGASFVKPVRYLRKVAPAVYRQLNRPAAAAAVGAGASGGAFRPVS